MGARPRSPQAPGPSDAVSSRRTRKVARQPSALGAAIEGFVARDGRSLNRIAQAALIDVAYLWRLRTGNKQRPSRDILIRLALALKLEPEDLDELLIAADYTPITLRPL